MKKEQPNNKFSDKFKNYQSGMDIDAAWQQLEEKRYPKEDRRRFFLPYFLLLGMALFILFFGTYISSKNNNHTVQTNSNINEVIVNSSTTSIQDKETAQPIQKNSNNTITSNQMNDIKDNNNIFDTKNSKTATIPITPKNSSPLQQSHSMFNNIALNHSVHSNFNNTDKQYPTNEMKAIGSVEVSNLSRDLFFSEIKSLPSLNLLATSNENANELLSGHRIDLVDILPTHDLSSSFWIGLSGGYGKASKSLEATDNTQTTLVQLRNQAEDPLDVFYVDLFFQKKLSQKFFLKSGIGFSQRTDFFSDSYVLNYTEIDDNYLIEIRQLPDGTQEDIYGPAEIDVEETFFETKYLRKQYFQCERTNNFIP